MTHPKVVRPVIKEVPELSSYGTNETSIAELTLELTLDKTVRPGEYNLQFT
jgi:zinc metalloproteinase-like repeat protein